MIVTNVYYIMNKRGSEMGSEIVARKSATVTEKKVKIEGIRRFMDIDTGEIIDFQTSRIESRDFNFDKVWIPSFLASLDLIGGKRFHVAKWIIEHRDRENRVIGTIRSIAEQTETSPATVQQVINAFTGCGFIRRVSSGVYMVDPSTVYRGTHASRIGVAQIYQSLGESDEPTTPSIDEQIEQVTSSIADLQKRLDTLKRSRDATDVEIDGQMTILDEDMTIGQRAKPARRSKKS